MLDFELSFGFLVSLLLLDIIFAIYFLLKYKKKYKYILLILIIIFIFLLKLIISFTIKDFGSIDIGFRD